LEDFSSAAETTDEKRLSLSRTSSNLIRKKTNDESENTTPSNTYKGYVGPLTMSERMEKVLKHLQRKRLKS